MATKTDMDIGMLINVTLYFNKKNRKQLSEISGGIEVSFLRQNMCCWKIYPLVSWSDTIPTAIGVNLIWI